MADLDWGLVETGVRTPEPVTTPELPNNTQDIFNQAQGYYNTVSKNKDSSMWDEQDAKAYGIVFGTDSRNASATYIKDVVFQNKDKNLQDWYSAMTGSGWQMSIKEMRPNGDVVFFSQSTGGARQAGQDRTGYYVYSPSKGEAQYFGEGFSSQAQYGTQKRPSNPLQLKDGLWISSDVEGETHKNIIDKWANTPDYLERQANKQYYGKELNDKDMLSLGIDAAKGRQQRDAIQYYNEHGQSIEDVALLYDAGVITKDEWDTITKSVTGKEMTSAEWKDYFVKIDNQSTVDAKKDYSNYRPYDISSLPKGLQSLYSIPVIGKALEHLVIPQFDKDGQFTTAKVDLSGLPKATGVGFIDALGAAMAPYTLLPSDRTNQVPMEEWTNKSIDAYRSMPAFAQSIVDAMLVPVRGTDGKIEFRADLQGVAKLAWDTQPLNLALEAVNKATDFISGIMTVPLWIDRPGVDPKFKEAIKSIYSPIGYAIENNTDIAKTIGGIPENVGYFVRNLNEQYDINASIAEKIGSLAIQAVLLPSGKAKTANLILNSEVKAAIKGLSNSHLIRNEAVEQARTIEGWMKGVNVGVPVPVMQRELANLGKTIAQQDRDIATQMTRINELTRGQGNKAVSQMLGEVQTQNLKAQKVLNSLYKDKSDLLKAGKVTSQLDVKIQKAEQELIESTERFKGITLNSAAQDANILTREVTTKTVKGNGDLPSIRDYVIGTSDVMGSPGKSRISFSTTDNAEAQSLMQSISDKYNKMSTEQRTNAKSLFNTVLGERGTYDRIYKRTMSELQLIDKHLTDISKNKYSFRQMFYDAQKLQEKGAITTTETFTKGKSSYGTLTALPETAVLKETILKNTNEVMTDSKSTQNVAKNLTTLWNALRGASRSLSAVEASTFNRITSVVDVPFTGKMAGYAKNWKGNGSHSNLVQNMYEFPSEFRPTDPAMSVIYKNFKETPQWIAYNGIQERRRASFEKLGIDIKKLSLEEQQYYSGHYYMAADDIGRGSGLGLKSQEYNRKFKTLDDAVAHGMKPEPNFSNVVLKTLEDSYSIIARNQWVLEAEKFGTRALPSMPTINLKGSQIVVKGLTTLSSRLAGSQQTGGELPRGFLAGAKQLSPTLAEAVERGATHDELMTVAREQLKIANKNLDIFKNLSAEEGVFKGLKGVPGLEGAKFPAELQKELVKGLTPQQPHGILSAMLGTAQVTRFGLTAFDLGAPNIHGLPLLHTHPAQWRNGVVNQFKATFQKNWLNEYISHNKDDIVSAVKDGHMTFNSPEYMEGAGIIGKIRGLNEISQPFTRGFTAFVDTSRLELYVSQRMPGMSAKELKVVGNFADNFLGQMTMINVTPKQKAWLTTSFFAPMYYGAGLNMVRSVFTGGLRGSLAAKHMAGYLGAMNMGYYALTQKLGVEANLNPADSNYLTIKIGNDEYSFAGFHVGLYKTMAKLAQAAFENPEKIPQLGATYLRGKASVVSRLPIDAFLGENFRGESVVANGAPGFLFKELIEAGLPIWMQNMIQGYEGDDFSDKLTRGAVEFAGAKAQISGTYEQRDNKLNELAQTQFKTDIDTLWNIDPAAAKTLYEHPDIQKLSAKLDAENAVKGAGWWNNEKQWLEYAPQRNAIKNEARTNINAAVWDAQNGVLDPAGLRAAFTNANSKKWELQSALDAKFPEIANRLYDPKQVPNNASRNYQAYIDYTDYYMNHPKLQALEQLYGDVPSAVWAKAATEVDKEFVTKWGKETFDYVQKTLLTGNSYSPTYVEYYLAKKEIAQSGYWDLPQDADTRLQWREMHPDIDAKMFFTGYVKTLQHPDAVSLAKNLIDGHGLKVEVPEASQTVRTRQQTDQLKATVAQMRSGKTANFMSNEVRNLTNGGYAIANEIYALEKGIKNAVTLDQKEAKIADMNRAITKLTTFGSMLTEYSKSHSEYYLDILNLQNQIWQLEQKERITRNSR